MNHRRHTIITLLIIIFANIAGILVAQNGEPWTAQDLIAPEALASKLNNPKAQQPVIYNIGPLADIKGAINIGSTSGKANLDKLGRALANVPKDYEARLVKLDFNYAAEQRERILKEWTTRYDGKSEKR